MRPLSKSAFIVVLLSASMLFPQCLRGSLEDDLVYPGPGVTGPKLTRRVDATYSQAALNAKIQGNVFLELVIDESGMPDRRLYIDSNFFAPSITAKYAYP